LRNFTKSNDVSRLLFHLSCAATFLRQYVHSFESDNSLFAETYESKKLRSFWNYFISALFDYSKCPGRFFATVQLKLFLLLVLLRFDIEMVDHEAAPTCDVQKMGIGAMPPTTDVKVRMKIKTTHEAW